MLKWWRKSKAFVVGYQETNYNEIEAEGFPRPLVSDLVSSKLRDVHFAHQIKNTVLLQNNYFVMFYDH